MNIQNRKSAESFPQLPLYFDSMETRKSLEMGINTLLAPKVTPPQANIIDTPDAIIVEMAVPGMEKENFSVAVNDGVLHVEINPTRRALRGGQYLLREFDYQDFERHFQLPNKLIDESGIDAQYEQGILQVSIPKINSRDEDFPRWIDID